MNLVVMLLN